MCKVTSGRKGPKGGSDLGALDFARKDKGGAASGSMLSELETYLTAQEKELGISKVDYEQFVYLIKRYSYKGTPLLEHMFQEISKDIGIEYEDIGENAADKHSLAYMTIKNREIF